MIRFKIIIIIIITIIITTTTTTKRILIVGKMTRMHNVYIFRELL